MSEVTVSSKYQIVIPREIRKSMKIRPGQKLSVVASEFSIRLMTCRSIREMEGFLKDFDGPDVPDFEREPDREF
jgi:AbrB family looped-hinge helix DNA binding protein